MKQSCLRTFDFENFSVRSRISVCCIRYDINKKKETLAHASEHKAILKIKCNITFSIQSLSSYSFQSVTSFFMIYYWHYLTNSLRDLAELLRCLFFWRPPVLRRRLQGEWDTKAPEHSDVNRIKKGVIALKNQICLGEMYAGGSIKKYNSLYQ